MGQLVDEALRSMMRVHQGDLEPIVRALRRCGDEAQLTQALAAVAADDAAFASTLLGVILAAAPEKRRVSALQPLPATLRCVPEHRLEDAVGTAKGFVDLRFDDDEGDFAVLVELKLHSGYGSDQLERYLDGLTSLYAPRAALVSVTRDFPRYGEDIVRQDPRWCGSVRWARIFDQLRDLEHTNPLLESAWRTLLDIVRSDGDFGTMSLDPDDVQGWNHSFEARDAMIAVLNEISDRALEIVRDELAPRLGAPTPPGVAEFRVQRGRRVWPWKYRLNLQVQVPAGAGERLRIQFLGGNEGGPHFTVEARHPDARRMLAEPSHPVSVASRSLEALGFAVGRDWEQYWSRLHPPSEWLFAGPNLHDVLLDIVAADVRDLASSGIFDALPPDPATGRREAPPVDLIDEGSDERSADPAP